MQMHPANEAALSRQRPRSTPRQRRTPAMVSKLESWNCEWRSSSWRRARQRRAVRRPSGSASRRRGAWVKPSKNSRSSPRRLVLSAIGCANFMRRWQTPGHSWKLLSRTTSISLSSLRRRRSRLTTFAPPQSEARKTSELRNSRAALQPTWTQSTTWSDCLRHTWMGSNLLWRCSWMKFLRLRARRSRTPLPSSKWNSWWHEVSAVGRRWQSFDLASRTSLR
mmetsp:Transcript_7703/g.19672  ORF Transcript_7703/g.19672 Transcript_7703/m.19672 type:complete len:222 (-) Transcript_7703:140-805(-)